MPGTGVSLRDRLIFAFTMSDHLEAISLFELFMEEGDETDLARALALLDTSQIRISEILPRIQLFKADPRRKAMAIMSIRKYFGLPLIPGPVCRR